MASVERLGWINKIKLFKLLKKNGIIFISGDVHYSLISQSPCSSQTGYRIPEFTSSGMTHCELEFAGMVFPAELYTLMQNPLYSSDLL